MKNKKRIISAVLFISLPFLIPFFVIAQNCQLEQALFEKADTMKNRDSAVVILEAIRPILKECQSWDTLLNTYNIEFNYHYNKWDLANAEKTLQKGFLQQQSIKKMEMSGVYLHNNLGLLELWKANNRNALKAFQTANELYEQVDNPHVNYLFTLKNNLGFSYQLLGDFKLANFYNQEALNLIQSKQIFMEDFYTESNLWRQIKLYGNIARNYTYTKDFVSAKNQLSEGLKLFPFPLKNKELSIYYCDFLLSIAVNFQHLNQFDSAQIYLKKAQPYLQSDLQEANYLKIVGEHHFHEKNYPSAQNKFEKSQAILIENYGQNNTEVAQMYQSIGACYRKKVNWQQAVTAYQNAINAVTDTTFNSNDIEVLPKEHQVISKIDLIEILKEKCIALNHLSNNKTDSLKNLKIVLQHYQYITQLSDQLRQNYQTEEAKIFLSAESNAYFEKAIDVAKSLYDLTGDEAFLETAFFFCEKSKSVVLLDEIKLKEVAGQSILPDTILQKQQEIKTAINNLEQSLAIEKRKAVPDETQIDDYENQLLTFMQQKIKLSEWIDENYPSYQALTQPQPVSIAEIRKELLQENQTLLEYFVGDDQIFLFVIAQDRLELLTIDQDVGLAKNIQNLLDNRKMNNPDFAKNAYYLYQKLVKISQCPPQENLLIVPDGILTFLPFEMLLTDTTENTFPKKMSWLLKKHACGYAYSATILTLQSRKKISNASVLAIAPIFKNTPKELRHVDVELAAFEHIKHKKILEEEASIANFKNLSAQFDVLHFSTHANSIDSITKQPSIDFFDGKIHLSEFYTFKLNAHLAVLSACETAVGDLKKGEGVMSLSRGLSYAGIPSLVTTLWAVNDQSTAEIVRDFYKEISEAKNKVEALQEAKLTYLAVASEDLAVPYYWAAPVLVGNAQAINFEGDTWADYAALIGFFSVLIILVGLFFFRRSKK